MKDLFGNEIGQPDKQPKRMLNHGAVVAHQKLIQIHGITEGKKCKDCELCLLRSYGKNYYKCTLYRTGASISSDWRANWQACGKFEATK